MSATLSNAVVVVRRFCPSLSVVVRRCPLVSVFASVSKLFELCAERTRRRRPMALRCVAPSRDRPEHLGYGPKNGRRHGRTNGQQQKQRRPLVSVFLSVFKRLTCAPRGAVGGDGTERRRPDHAPRPRPTPHAPRPTPTINAQRLPINAQPINHWHVLCRPTLSLSRTRRQQPRLPIHLARSRAI